MTVENMTKTLEQAIRNWNKTDLRVTFGGVTYWFREYVHADVLVDYAGREVARVERIFVEVEK